MGFNGVLKKFKWVVEESFKGSFKGVLRKIEGCL